MLVRFHRQRCRGLVHETNSQLMGRVHLLFVRRREAVSLVVLRVVAVPIDKARRLSLKNDTLNGVLAVIPRRGGIRKLRRRREAGHVEDGAFMPALSPGRCVVDSSFVSLHLLFPFSLRVLLILRGSR